MDTQNIASRSIARCQIKKNKFLFCLSLHDRSACYKLSKSKFSATRKTTKGYFMNENNKLDGTWGNGLFKLIIKGDRYTSYYNHFQYGKGTIVYNGENFTLTSTHAKSKFFFWVPFVESVKGKYHITDSKVTISNIEGRYCDQNGIWAQLKSR